MFRKIHIYSGIESIETKNIHSVNFQQLTLKVIFPITNSVIMRTATWESVSLTHE